MFKYCDILRITYALGLRIFRLLNQPQQICLSEWRSWCLVIRELQKLLLNQKISPAQPGLTQSGYGRIQFP